MTVSEGAIAWGVKPNHPEEDDWFQYTVGDRVGGVGGAGVVHRLAPDTEPPLVGKFYNDAILSHIRGDEKYFLRVILPALNRNLLMDDLPFATWPRRVLFDMHDPDGRKIRDHLIGFTMPLLIGTTSLHDLIHRDQARLRLTAHGTVHIATTIASQLAQMHRHAWGFVFGDMSPTNIHISHDHAKVHFIDVDSFQFDYDGGAYSFFLSGLTPTFTSPGARAAIDAKSRVTAAHDDFVLAILIFMMLMADKGYPVHPFSSLDSDEDELIEARQFPFDNPAKHPVSDAELKGYRELPDDIREAFSKTFTRTPPVTASEWTVLLTNLRRSLWRSQ